MANWRPEGWDKIKQTVGDEILNQEDYIDRLIEFGADAILEGLKKELDVEDIKAYGSQCGMCLKFLIPKEAECCEIS